jgi:outer membrane lipoprotein-sorting protein
MRLLLLPVVLLAFAEDGKEAEKLFRAAEKKLLDADTVQMSFTATATHDKGKLEGKGTVLLARGNKARLEMKGTFLGKSGSLLMICDGTRQKTESAEAGKEGKGMVRDAPKDFTTRLTKATTRIGILPSFFLVRAQAEGEKDPDVEDVMKVSDFSLGKKEKVGERQAQIVEYKMTHDAGGGRKDTHTVQLWLDSETHLPLKRVVRGGKEGEGFPPITETYDIRLNGPIDKVKFEVPKEK